MIIYPTAANLAEERALLVSVIANRLGFIVESHGEFKPVIEVALSKVRTYEALAEIIVKEIEEFNTLESQIGRSMVKPLEVKK